MRSWEEEEECQLEVSSWEEGGVSRWEDGGLCELGNYM